MISGVVWQILTKDVNGKKVVFYEVMYKHSGGLERLREVRALKCYPGRYEESTPAPDLPLFGTEITPPAEPSSPLSRNLLLDDSQSSITTGSFTHDPRTTSPPLPMFPRTPAVNLPD
jgi:hypothetical protein